MTEILEILKIGGEPVVLVFLVVVWWKLDRRIVRLETLINNEIGHRLKELEDRFRGIEGQ